MISRVSPQELKDQLLRIKASPMFAGARQLHVFLDLLSTTTSSRNGTRSISQAEIARALGLREFDSTKPTVRIAAGRLRSRLMEFYATQGREDAVIIDFPKGRPYRLNLYKKPNRDLPPAGKTFHLCCEGRMLWAQRTPESLKKAAACFHKAIHIDSRCVEAHAALAQCYLFMALSGTAPRQVMRQAKVHAEKSVGIDPYSAEAHVSLAAILSAFDWNWERAGREFDKAFELDPNSLALYCFRADYLLSIGKTEDAAADARRILHMTAAGPSPLVGCHAAKILFAAGKNGESKELLAHLRAMGPDFYTVHWEMGLLNGTLGNFPAAEDCLEKALTLCPRNPSVLAGLGWVKALAGKLETAKRVKSSLLAHRRRQYVPATDLAMICAALGEMDAALDWLHSACRERAIFLPWLSVWPPFGPLRTHPFSTAILEQMGLTSSTSVTKMTTSFNSGH